MRRIFLAFLALTLFLAACQPQDLNDEVCFEEQCFQVEVVDTPEERQRGLMYRTSLDQDKGMLFVWEESGQYNFWMKNTKISLDMIWMDQYGVVQYIKHKAPPCTEDPCPSYGPSSQARYVLEINGGLSEELGIEVGDQAEIKV